MDFEDDERIPPKTKLPELFKLVDESERKFIDSLRKAVSIPSVSDCPRHRDYVLKMLKYCAEELESLGAKIDMVDGNDNSSATELPPVLFANVFVGDEHKTICVYGNIDTLLPKTTEADKLSPFKLHEENGRLYGCGVSDNKGPLLCWLNALKIYKSSENELPVNLKFVIEGTAESYSESLRNAIKKRRQFFSDVEYICMTIDKRVNDMPCLKYGYRGLCCFSLKISCGEKRVHSGTYGGAFNQPLMDAINIVGSLIDKHGKIAVSDFMEDARPITEKDEELSKKQFCPIKTLREKTGVASLIHKEIPSRIITHKTRLPSLTVNAFHIKSASADKDDCASIPNKIEAIFSVRLVPDQCVNKTVRQFESYVEKQWNNYKSANSHKFKMTLGFDPWQEDPSSDHFAAAAAAIDTVYNTKPIYVSEGNTMPAVSIFYKACPASGIIIMPLSGHDDGHHSCSESISKSNYIQGIKLVMSYMCEIHELNFK